MSYTPPGRVRAALAAARSSVAERPRWRRSLRQDNRAGDGSPLRDLVIVEAPLQIRVAGDPLITTMRTPGRDHDLTLGFLFSEGLIASAADVFSIVHCGRPDSPGHGNVIDVQPGPGFAFDPESLEATRRLGHAGCGVCGRREIDDLLARCAPVPQPDRRPLALSLMFDACEVLHTLQADFSVTGGCHAAAALDRDGRLLAHAEDVGRHNALDKVLGALLRLSPSEHASAGRPGDALADVVAVSGRAGFELAQKAIVAGAQALCSVSAPSSLAIDLAERAGMCLVGFVRKGRCNVYSHPERLCGTR